ncbi:hypothetical protein CRUP_035572, partial [Coryphaenoides rupestris]
MDFMMSSISCRKSQRNRTAGALLKGFRGLLPRRGGGNSNPSNSQNKKSIKQRFLLLLPCCSPPAPPSIQESMDKLQEQTKFTKKELQVLYRGFKNECPSGVVNEDNFKTIYSQFFPQGDSSMYAHFLFEAFDTDKNGSVSFEDFVFGLSIILRGTINDRLNWAFNLYDLNKDGCITKEEMLDIMKSIYDMMGKYTYPNMQDEAPREHVENFFQDENIMQSMQLFDNDLKMAAIRNIRRHRDSRVKNHSGTNILVTSVR